MACLAAVLCSCSACNTEPNVGVVQGNSGSLRPSFKRLIAYYDSKYDEQAKMICEEFNSPGYHSKIPSGENVHPTRESLYYAVALLQRYQSTIGDTRGNPMHADRLRAQQIIAAILPLQETDSLKKEYGVWPWLLEEPLQEMDSIDLNWADFCGAALAQIIVQHSSHIDSDLQKQIKTALRHAANAIKQRDVQPGYTNIAVLGGGVCAVAGEILDDSALLNYGRDRLDAVVQYTNRLGGFAEYNSPPYGKVVIAECERILQLAEDDRVRASAESLRVSAWKMIANSFHPGTQQWAGPHSRMSRLRLTGTMVDFINDRTGLAIKAHSEREPERPRGYAIIEPISCPVELVSKLRNQREDRYQIKRTFIPGKNEKAPTTGTTWFSPGACLGSVSRSSMWVQRNPLVGYWKTDQESAVTFRVRFLNEGRDFASMEIRSDQMENRVLSIFTPLKKRGDWHRSLDRPADGVFQTQEFRLRYEINGKSVTAKEISNNRFSLTAGDHHVVISPALQSHFNGQPLRWEFGHDEEEECAYVEAICYSGERTAFNFNNPIEMQIAVGVALESPASIGGNAKISLPEFEHEDGVTTAVWQTEICDPLKAIVPRR